MPLLLVDSSDDWIVEPPALEDRICGCREHSFSMYDSVLRVIKVKLPLPVFHVEVLAWVKVSPSQLHP